MIVNLAIAKTSSAFLLITRIRKPFSLYWEETIEESLPFDSFSSRPDPIQRAWNAIEALRNKPIATTVNRE